MIAERRALGVPAHHRSRQGDARRVAEPRRGDADGHQSRTACFASRFGIALALAGAAGSLLMPFYSAYPFVGQVFVLMAFVAVVLGTLGNVIGALVASLMMGVAESLGIQYRRRRFRIDRGVCDAAADARLQAERPRRRESAMMARPSTEARGAGRACDRSCCIALPQVVKSSFAIDIFIRILLFSFIGVAWNLMGGYAKQLSLGHAAYFGLGAYTSTILQIDFGISPWIGMVAGGVVAMLASLPIGWLCFRLRGPYFTIATIATAQALMLIFLKFRDFAWGAEGTTIPNLGSAPLMMQFETKASYYYVVARPARARAGHHLADRAILDGLLPRRHRRGRGRRRSDRRQRAEDQARHLHDLRVSHRARRHVLHPVHLLHRSRRPRSASTSRSRRRWCRSSAASARCGVR